jgi:hypothetical protein
MIQPKRVVNTPLGEPLAGRGAQYMMTRGFTVAWTASLLVAGAFVVLSGENSRAQAPGSSCEDAAQLAVLPSPVAPWKGAPLRVVFAAEKPLRGELSLIAPDGSVAAASHDRQGGPPYFWFAEVATPAAGTWHARLVREGAPAECTTINHEITVAATQPPRLADNSGGVWGMRSDWNRDTENLYSAWIEKLFDAPLDATVSYKALHEVLRDPSKNILFNHLGLKEDQSNITIRPDCADLPYFLRAYFAWKMGLPYGYSKCSRGDGDAPRCFQWLNVLNPEAARAEAPPVTRTAAVDMFGRPVAAPVVPERAPATPPSARSVGLVQSFARYIPILADGVHSGSGRTALNDNNTDYYPVPLTEDTLRPGTVYADPYGHILMIAKRIAQTSDDAGIILAVDAQPDGTVARKRFWRGNFLFAQNPALGGPGFKRFRPIVREKNGSLRRLTNAEIAKDADYADFSLDQAHYSVEDFYDRMDDVMSPQPLEPVRAMKEAIASLEEQVKARVTSVENGRKYQLSGKGDAEMPNGATIFETNGAWEDFATPARDLRLLIAIDVVRTFPDRVARRSERYAMPQGKSVAQVKAEMESVLATELAARKFSYPRTDGSQWTLSLKDVNDRSTDLEMAYNLNDCVELRWGAKQGSEESGTCKRHAPQGQRAKMSDYRAWFHERRRPPRGA